MIDFFIRFWAEILLGALVVAVATLYRKYKATQLGIQALLRSALIKIYNRYIEPEEMPIYEKENAEALFKQYTALGGNGTVKGLYDEMMRLPTPQKKRHER